MTLIDSRSLGIALAAGCALLLPSWGGAPAPKPEAPTATLRPAPNAVKRTGTITGWHLSSDGSLAVHVSGPTEDGKQRGTWFKTPPSTTANTRFEHLVLDVVLHSTDSRAGSALIPLAKGTPKGHPAGALTLVGERVNDADGSSVEKAYELASIRKSAQ